jgi:hypothetical protein
MVNLSAIAFAVRRALTAQGAHMSAGHAHQLVAAALGHNSLASYQIARDDPGLEEAHDIVIDAQRLEMRAKELGHVEVDIAGPIFRAISARHIDATVHRELNSYLAELQEFVDERAPLDEAVNSEVACTNGWMPTANIELPLWDDFDAEDSHDIHVELSGLVTVEQDHDRVFYGDEVEVDATLDVERFGRMLFGARHFGVQRARLRWLGEPTSGDIKSTEADEMA